MDNKIKRLAKEKAVYGLDGIVASVRSTSNRIHLISTEMRTFNINLGREAQLDSVEKIGEFKRTLENEVRMLNSSINILQELYKDYNYEANSD